MNEQWKLIDESPAYEISTSGRVRRASTQQVLKTTPDRSGYMRVPLRNSDGKAINRAIHRLVAVHFLGPAPDGTVAAHLDGDRKNNALSNLAFVTPEENNRHKDIHGTRPRGASHQFSKLTAEQVAEIRACFLPGSREFGARPLATKFGVDPVTIRRAVNGTSWTGGPGPIVRLRQRVADLEEELKHALDRVELFLSTFGDMGERYSTLADIEDWRSTLSPEDSQP